MIFFLIQSKAPSARRLALLSNDSIVFSSNSIDVNSSLWPNLWPEVAWDSASFIVVSKRFVLGCSITSGEEKRSFTVEGGEQTYIRGMDAALHFYPEFSRMLDNDTGNTVLVGDIEKRRRIIPVVVIGRGVGGRREVAHTFIPQALAR